MTGPCMYCGLNPAEGYAAIYKDGEEKRYCHGDDDGASCYERRVMIGALIGD